MLARQTNAGRLFGQAVTEFSRPVWSGRDHGRSSAGDNERAVLTSSLRNSQVRVCHSR